jgi:hypothetical protein
VALLLAVGMVASLLAIGIVTPAGAQSSEVLWSEPVNLSRSGAASQAQVVVGPDGLVQTFWWDQFDGLMTAYRVNSSWTDRAKAPIVITEIVGEGAQAEVVSTPIAAMPYLAAGAGYTHAFWLGEPDEETDIRPFLHSRLSLGSTAWSNPRQVAETALAWKMTAAPDGTLHLIYLRPLHTEGAAAGVYYQRSTNGGASWSAPSPLYQTVYLRLVEAEDVHLWLAADDQGRVYATWDDPRPEQTFLAVSADLGVTWSTARWIEQDLLQAQTGGQGAQRARFVLTGDQPLLLWEATGAAAGCRLYQQQVTPPAIGDLAATEAADLALGEPQRVLDPLGACPEAPTFLRFSAGNPLFITTNEGLTVAAWNGTQWSEPKSLSFSFGHPELGGQVYLDGLHTALGGDRLVVVGQGTSGDIWYLESVVEAWDWAFAPSPPWSQPTNVSQDNRPTGLPALAVDAEGRLHAMWGDPSPGLDVEPAADGPPTGALTYVRLEPAASGASDQGASQWTRPNEVLQSPQGAARDPVLVAHGDQLFALWSGGHNGAIYASRAFVLDAYAPGGWSEPTVVPMGGVTASSPAVIVDVHGVLHVVYAAPLNEGRGIYYLRSDPSFQDSEGGQPDAGFSWSEPRLVFDAQAAGFAAVDHPALALDPAGMLHVVWVRGSSMGAFPPQAVLHSASDDGGLTWTEPRILAEGAFDWPMVAAPLAGEVHVLWNQVQGGSSWTHRWSLDYGQTWTYQQRVLGFGEVPGPAGMTADGAGNLHLVGVERDEGSAPVLVYAFWRWEEERWEEEELFRVDGAGYPLPGVAAALLGDQGRLDVLFRAWAAGEGQTRRDVLHSWRTVAVVPEGPAPAYTPVPTVTPTPVPTLTPTATPRPTVAAAPPPDAPPSVGFGPITLPLIAVGGIGLILIIIVGILLTRAGSGRR